MVRFILLLLILNLSSCFNSSSEIRPIAEPVELSDKIGDGEDVVLNLHYPFIDKEITEYRGDELIFGEDRGLFKPVVDIFAFPVAKQIAKALRFKIPTKIIFPYFDPEIFKSLKIKRVFFFIKDCDNDPDCRKKKKRSSFEIIKELFVNVSPYNHEEHGRELIESESSDYSYAISRKMYSEKMKKAIKGSQKKNLIDYTLGIYNRDNNTLKNKFVRDVFKKKSFLPIFIFSHPTRFVELKEFFERHKLSKLVKKVFLTGEDVVVDLNQVKGTQTNTLILDKFISYINGPEAQRSGLFRFNMGKNISYKQCEIGTCLEMDLTSNNLMDIFKTTNELKIDTYLRANKLTKFHFDYKGFVEIEVKLNLPL